MDETKITRKCIACNSIKPRPELIKITQNNKTNEIVIQPNSYCMGRSTYICKKKECVDKALKKGRLYKILKIKQDESIEEKIRAVLER